MPGLSRRSLSPFLPVLIVAVGIFAVSCGAEPAASPDPATPVATSIPTEAPPTSEPTAVPTKVPETTEPATPGPAPTQVPEAPTPVPASTSTPEPQPDPVPEEATPADRVPFTEWPLDRSSVGADLTALLPADEVSCLESTLGDEYEVLLAMPIEGGLAAMLGGPDSPAADCLGDESVAGIGVAMLASTAGGLSAGSRVCIGEILAANRDVEFAIQGGIDSNPDLAFEMFACLTDDEMSSLAPDDDPLPDFDAFACMTEALSALPGGEDIVQVLITGDPAGLTLEQGAILGQAIEACDIDTGFEFP